VVFSPALPLGARIVDTSMTVQPTPGDVHVTVKGVLTDAVELSVAYAGGWQIVPPSMPATIGRRSEAPRVLSERLAADGRYIVSLEGIAGRQYSFRVRTPDAAAARALATEVTGGGAVEMSDVVSGASERRVAVTFPEKGANSDGYTAVTVSFGRQVPGKQ
jgi:hypothetical protein